MIVIQRCPICKSTDIQEKAWINVNKIPYKIVINNPLVVADLSPANIAL